MADITISKFTTQVLRQGSTPASPGFAVDEGQNPTDPSGNPPTHLPVTIAPAADGLSITDSQVLGGAGTTAQYLRGDGSLATFPALTGFVPYTGATADVDLGTHDLTAERGTFENNGSSDTLTVNHTSGSGKGINVSKGGNGEALLVTKTSGSGNAMAVVGGRTSLVDLSLSSVSNATGNFLTISGGVVHQRTPSETRSDVGAQAQLNGTGFVKASGTTITYDNSTYQVTSEKAQPNGYASLDSNGKVPLVQINDALIGNVNFQGLWNAATNTPTLANPPASGTKGYYYIVSTAGTFSGISFEVGDWIISNGTAWGKVDNTDAVSSVFGRTGNVTASNGDYNTSQVTENTNLYYTEARVNANANVAANTAARHNAVTLGTANGLSLSTQVLSLQLATSGQNGALSSTDWSTFNNKENAITAGTTAQYFRGDKTFQTLNTGVVPESGNLYFTNARAIASVLTGYTSGAGTISAADSILSAIQKLNGNIGALVTGVSSVNGLTGVVVLTTTNIAEGTNLYYTEARVNANTNVAANTAARHAAVTIGTANGLSLSTQQLSLGLASAGVTGALSGTDWSTFNNKANANGSNASGTWGISITGNAATVSNIGGASWTQGSNIFLNQTGNNQEWSFDIYRNGFTGGYWHVWDSGNGEMLRVEATNGKVYAPYNFVGNLEGNAATVTNGVYTSRTITINGTTQDLSDNRTYNVGTVTDVTASTPLFSSGGATPNITIQQASGSQNGFLSSTDWTTFNNKQAALNGTGFVKIIGTTISYDNSTYLTTAAAASTYVPYTGATSGVDIGTYTLSASNLIANGGFNAGALLLKQSSNAQTIFLGYTAITPVGNNTLNFGFSTGSGVWKNFTLSSFLLTDNINRTYTLPDASGTIALVGGSGVGTVTSVAALTLGTSGTDLSSSVANGTTTPVITLNVPTASAANRGALSAADWTTFNGKQDNIVAGTTAQYYRGDKTFQTLNTAAVPESGNLYYTEARVNANANVAANTAARHNAVTLGTANGLSLSTQQLSLGLASSSANGALSSTDWTTFNNKQNALTNPVTGTGTTNYLPKFTGASTIGNSQIFDDGTNVGIGTTASTTKLRSNGTVQITAAGSPTNGAGLEMGYGNFTAGRTTITSYNRDGAAFIGNDYNALDYIWYTVGALKMTLNSSGNLGLGVTPSAWSLGKAIQVNNASFWGYLNNAHVLANAYFDSGFKYVANGVAALYEQNNAAHIWYTAPSGTAGNAISFTQAMTLDASGNLMVGGTSVYGATITSYASATRSGGIGIRNSAGTIAGSFSTYAAGSGSGSTDIFVESAGFMAFASGGSERMRIFSDGNVSISNSPSNAGFKLDVNGTGRFSGTLTTAGISATSLFTSGTIDVGMSPAPFWNARFRDFSDNSGVFIGSVAAGGYKFISGDSFYFNSLQWHSTNTVSSVINLQGGNFAVYTNSGLTANTNFTPTERFRINESGAATFSVNTNASLLITNSGQTPILSFRSNGVTAAGRIRVAEAFGGGEMVFSTKTTGGVDTDRMMINTSGNVGIGTDSPAQLLHLYKASGAVFLALQSSTNYGYLFNDGTNIGLASDIGSTGLKFLVNRNAPDNIMSITSGGNVLIGTTTDNSNKLRVNGSIWADGNILMDSSVNRFVGFGTGNSNAHISFLSTNTLSLNSSSGGLIQFNINGNQIGRFNSVEVFANSVLTSAPYGTTARSWKLGRYITETTSADGSIRVEIDGRYYNIAAQDLGVVPS
jgi:hypothetical protein